VCLVLKRGDAQAEAKVLPSADDTFMLAKFSALGVGSLALVLALAATSVAETISLSPQGDWFSRLDGSSLQPGDEVVLTEGTYAHARRLVLGHRGTADKPIIIRAADNQRVVFKRPDAEQNTLNLEGCQYLTLRGLEITGGSTAIRIGNDGSGQTSSDVVLEELHIHHIGGVAITCNNPGSEYRRMTFRRNHIHHTADHGEAFYLGANDAKATFADSVIENNYIHHLNGPEVSQGDGIEIKLGSFNNRIVGNIIHDTKYPGITVYGTRKGDRNVIVGNLIWKTGDHGIQAAADAIIRDNWIADAGGCGIYSREHQGATPGNLTIENNHIFARHEPAIRIIGSTPASAVATIELTGNRLFATGGQLALRADNGVLLKAADNQGSGGVDGSPAFAKTWRPAAFKPTELPQLKDNPAWQSLDPAQVARQFAP
jgi:parallel beta-helix repeat protein